MALERFDLYLQGWVKEELEKMALETDTSMAQFIRDAITEKLERVKKDEEAKRGRVKK